MAICDIDGRPVDGARVSYSGAAPGGGSSTTVYMAAMAPWLGPSIESLTVASEISNYWLVSTKPVSID